MSESFLNSRIILHCGDCLDVLATLPENSIDSCVTDPPYHLTSIVKRFGKNGSAPAQFGKDGRFARLSGGFMNKHWDSPDVPPIDPCFANWMAGFIDGEGCFHVHKKQVNGCETYDCQFSMTLRADDKPILIEIQRQLGGIGTIADRQPTDSRNAKLQSRYCISSQRDCQRLREVLLAFPLRAKKARDFEIWSQALDTWLEHEPKSSWEDVAYFRDALMAVRQYGAAYHPSQLFHYRWARKVLRVLKPGAHLLSFCGTRTYHRMAVAIEDAGFEVRDTILWLHGQGFPKNHDIGDGWGTALKPAAEIVCLARKPLSEKTVAANVLKWGTGALNIDGCRIETTEQWEGRELPDAEDGVTWGGALNKQSSSRHPAGRWPANVIHDGSEEVVGAFPELHGHGSAVHSTGAIKGMFKQGKEARSLQQTGGEGGSAARFFYTSKADSDDRLGSKHPTVKPLDLMQYLVRLVTPKGGTVLDPFAGTGTTGEAAWREGMKAILIEREAEYQADICRRMELCLSGPDERQRQSVKAKMKDKPQDHGPLFGNVEQEKPRFVGSDGVARKRKEPMPNWQGIKNVP